MRLIHKTTDVGQGEYPGVKKKITAVVCEDVALINDPDGKKGKKFMQVHDRIVEILTSGDAWRALPDYEFLYD